MKEREKILVTGLTVLMLLLWLGFLFHHSPRFAGSFWGGVLGVTGTFLMLVPLLYAAVKRIKFLRNAVKPWVSLRTLLAWHIYAGVLGPILVILHSAHKFESLLGKALIGMTILVVWSGFVGRYFMSHFTREIRDKKKMLATMEKAYAQGTLALAAHPERAETFKWIAGWKSVVARLFSTEMSAVDEANSPLRLIRLSESIADVEYAIKTHEIFKKWFKVWLKCHIVISMFLYALMAFHVWAAIHFGLRWFEPTGPVGGARVGMYAPATTKSPLLANPSDPLASFIKHFEALYRRTWRPALKINGTSTTVFDYSEWARASKRENSQIAKAATALQHISLESFIADDTEKAFWINVYNFSAMKMAAEHYPVDSIRSPSISPGNDPWGLKIINVGGQMFSLKQVENEILLDRFDDPRIVFAVSCAAVSCPDRPKEIFDGERLSQQLDEIIRMLLANPDKGLRIDQALKTITISWIIKADKRLFKEEEGNGVLRFIARYAMEADAKWIRENSDQLKILFFEHDWGLNDTARVDKNSLGKGIGKSEEGAK